MTAFLATPKAARAEGNDWFSGTSHSRLALSPYTKHYRYSEEHKPVYAVAAEQQYDTGWLYGGSYFRNSFGQPSGYLYLGKRYDGVLDSAPPLFLQWSAGMLYGYRGKYEDKVPFNHKGFSPGALVSAGWQFNPQMSMQLNALGDAGVMFQFSYDFR